MTLGLVASLCSTVAGAGPAFPLRVAASGRYLEDQRGEPFFVNGDTAWSLTHNLTYEQAVRYLQNRRAKGINAVVVSVPDAYGPDGRASDGPDRQGNRPFLDDDISRPNEPYWQHVDRVLAESEALGFLVLLWPSYLGCCDDGYLGLLLRNGAAKASAYGRFIGARYAARKNLVWIHGGDRDPGAASEVVAAVKAGISQADPSSLQATHWSPETDPYAPFGEQFTSLYGTYTYGPVGALVSRHYQKLPVKPVLLLETHYENDWASKPVAELRKYPYRAALAGAAGHFFGNKPLWFCGDGWEVALESEGSRAMQHVGQLFRSRPWQRLVPDASDPLVTAGRGDPATDDGVQAARADDGSFAMAFVPDRRTIRVKLGQIAGAKVRAWWFDISSGSAVVAGNFLPSANPEFTPPGNGGFVLVLDDASRGYPRPGEAPVAESAVGGR